MDALTAFDTARQIFDLSTEGRGVFTVLEHLSATEKADSLQFTAKLLKMGIIGTETLDSPSGPVTTFVTTRIGAEPLRGYRPNRYGNRLDVRA